MVHGEFAGARRFTSSVQFSTTCSVLTGLSSDCVASAVDLAHASGTELPRIRRECCLFNTVNNADVWMIERSECTRFAFERRQAGGIGGKRVRKNFDRYITPEPCIVRAVDLAHAADTKQGVDAVDAEASTDQRGRLSRSPASFESICTSS
jgi:hypothetical protein